MKSSKRIRVATALTAVVAAVSMVGPAPASASGCTGKFAETCQRISNEICYTFGKCF
jgi:hypothetical protein